MCIFLCAAKLNKENGWDMKIHVDGASGAMIAPFIYPGVQWTLVLLPAVSHPLLRALPLYHAFAVLAGVPIASSADVLLQIPYHLMTPEKMRSEKR